MTEEAPFELVLVVGGGPRLRAVLRNGSAAKRLYCCDMFYQPPLLELRAPDGAVLRGQDQRIIMRPLDPLGKESFRWLEPGAVADLLETDVEPPREGGYFIHWGHQTFRGLPAGTYGVTAVLECRRTSWADEERRWHLEAEVWTGDLRSKEVEIRLP